MRDRIHAILRDEWNPIDVPGLPRDEYESYEREVAHMLERGTDVEELIRFLFVAEYGMFHDEEETLRAAQAEWVPPGRRESLAPIAGKLLALASEPKVIVHRDFPGEHGGADCWCRPLAVDADSPRDARDICAELSRLNG